MKLVVVLLTILWLIPFNHFYSGASFVSGKFGNAASFDGSNDYARNTIVTCRWL